MDAERWGRVRALFDEIVELPRAERAARLAVVCAGDATLEAEVQSLLDADAQTASESLQAVAPNLLDALAQRTEADADDRLIGLRLGPWKIERRIGTGGMGSVYLARRTDGEFEQEVAIKVLNTAGIADPELPARFRVERSILAQLDHPNIARLFDGGTLADGTPYLVMEYVEGERIDDRCRRTNATLEQRLDLFVEVCRAVQAAHRALIVHRDLKPANILVDTNSETKLLDFGIAKVLGETAANDAPATREGDRLLTPRYAAPEQIRGERITTATDVYALGVILYELLTGVSPYPAPTLDTLQLIREVADVDPPPPSRALRTSGTPPVEPRALRGDLDAIVAKALRKEPERRYETVDALAEDIRRYRRADPVDARRGDRAYRAFKLVQRHRLAFAVLAIALAGLAATAFTWRAQRDAIARERDRAEEATAILLDVFDQADPFVHRGSPPPLTDLVRRGAERLAAQGTTDAALRADLLSTLARVQLRLGAYPDALKSATAGRELVATLPGADPTLAATLALQAGDALRESNRRDEAQAAYEDALRTRDVPTVRAHALRGLGALATDTAKDDEAKKLLEGSVAAHLQVLGAASVDAAIAASKPGAPAEAFADTVQYVCRAALAEEQLDDAATWCERSRALRERIHPADHPSLGAPITAIARVHAGRREYAEAVEANRRALAILTKALGPDHPTVGAQHINTGLDLMAWGRYAEAVPHYEEAVRIMVAARGADHPWTLLARNNLANSRYLLGDYRASLALHEDVSSRRVMALPADHPDRAQSHNNIARAHWRLGELAAAREHYAKAMAIYEAGKAERSQSRSVRVGLAWLDFASGERAAALATARALETEIVAEKPDLDGLGSTLFLQAQATLPDDRTAALTLATRARDTLKADDLTRYLATPEEIDAWIVANR